MNVVKLPGMTKVERERQEEVILVLETALAKAKGGRPAGVIVCIDDSKNGEDVLFAGTYREDRAKAASCTMRLSMQMMQRDL